MKFFRFILVGLILVLSLSGILHASGVAAEQNPIRDRVWSVPLKATATPFATEGQLFVTAALPEREHPTLHALDAASGQVLWVSEEPIQRVLAVEDGKIYASNENHRLMVLEASTGKTTAAFQLETSPDLESLSSAIGAVGGAFISGVSLGFEVDRYEISALTPEQKLWTFLTPQHSQISSSFYEPYDVVLPAVRNGVVVLPILTNPQTEARGYQIVGLDGKTGKLLWQWETSEDFLDDVTVIDDTVYVAFAHSSASDELSWVKALDLNTGRERWSYPLFGKVKLASDREVFVWDEDDNNSTRFVVLDKETGAVLRKIDLAREDSREPREIALAGNTIYISDLRIENVTLGFYASADNHSWFDAFDAATGRKLWQTPTLFHSHVYRPVAGSDRLFVTGHALNENGQDVIQAFDIAE